MSPRQAFDAEDPFGTRPDEKPPAGWDESFWEGVRERIEDRKAGQEPPETPPTNQYNPFTLLTWLLFAAFSTAVIFGRGGPAPKESLPDDPGATFVRVSGAQAPSVDVEWARAGGNRSSYVVLQALDPDVSYVVLDSRPASPPRKAVSP